MKKYIHKKTGELYELVQDRILFRDIDELEGYYWRGNENSSEHLVMYRAIHNNPFGPYFVRHIEDFNENFEEYVEPYKPKECCECDHFFGCKHSHNDDDFDANTCESFVDHDEMWGWTR